MKTYKKNTAQTLIRIKMNDKLQKARVDAWREAHLFNCIQLI